MHEVIKMKGKNTKRIVLLLATSMVVAFFGAGTALADSENVTVTWIVPEDTSIRIEYPTGEVKIIFDATGIGMNFTNLSAKSQTIGTAALKVWNEGNTAINITFDFNSWHTNVTYVNVSVGDGANTSGAKWWNNANNTTGQTVTASLAMGGSEEYWFWSSGIYCPETAGTDRTLNIASAGV
jgi:hypothetical protein